MDGIRFIFGGKNSLNTSIVALRLVKYLNEHKAVEKVIEIYIMSTIKATNLRVERIHLQGSEIGNIAH